MSTCVLSRQRYYLNMSNAISPSARMIEAYETGKSVTNVTEWVYSSSFDEAFTEGVLGMFFEAGREGAEMPRFATGWRYGAAPTCGQSYNHRDERYEAGVSMMSVDGCDWESDGSYEMFNGAQDKVAVEGWLITNKRGADGEPLLWVK